MMSIVIIIITIILTFFHTSLATLSKTLLSLLLTWPIFSKLVVFVTFFNFVVFKENGYDTADVKDNLLKTMKIEGN